MKSTQKRHATRVSVIAVRAALMALAVVPAAHAEDASDEVLELTQARSEIEVGVGNVSKDSAKFGEFNGLSDKGGYFIGNFDLRGGGGNASAFRWRATGSNLGLENRSLGAEVGEQGRFRVTFGYDELKRDYTDSFQTIYNGTGTSTLTLPATYPAPATRLSATGNQNQALANWANPQSPYATAACAAIGGVPTPACAGPGYIIPAAMHQVDISTKRTRGDAGFSFRFSPELEFKASARREEKDGTKLTGWGINGPGRGFMLPEPINSTTDNYEAGISYAGKTGYLNLGYAGSHYRNDTNLWTAENPFQNLSMLNNIAQLSGAPDNQMHQFNYSGGYHFTPKTKLVVAGSYTRMTQNEPFNVNYPASFLIPVTSADAKVLNTSFSAKLTTQPTRDLKLNAAYKYDDRDNQTASHLYSVAGADNGTSASTNRTFANEPFSRRQQRFNIDADYSLGRGTAVSAGYEWQEIAYRANGENPIPADGNKENTFRLEFRNGLSDKLNGRIGYARSQRRMEGQYRDGDPLPLSPVVPEDLSTLIASGRITVGAGGILTQVAPFAFSAADAKLPGFRNFLVADRNRDALRSTLNFQASEAVALDAKLDYNRDNFGNSQYGLKESTSWVFALDASYAASENLSFNANYTYEDMKARMDSLSVLRTISANPAVAGATGTTLIAANTATVCAGSTLPAGSPANWWLDPCRQWGMQQADKIDTIGLGFKAAGLMAGRLELTGDLIYSRSRSPITLTGGTYYPNGATSGNNQVWVAAESLPEITTTMTELRLAGRYAINKATAVRLGYIGQRLRSSDFQLDAYSSPLAFQTYLSTGMTSPNYTVHVVQLSYLYSFR